MELLKCILSKSFQIPYIKQQLLAYDLNQIWQDLFAVDLTEKNISKKSAFRNLYLLHLRAQIFPDDLLGFYFYPKNNLNGLIRVRLSPPFFDIHVYISNPPSPEITILLISMVNNIKKPLL